MNTHVEISFPSPEDFEKAASLLCVPQSSAGTLIIQEELAEETLALLQENGIQGSVVPSDVSNEDLWPEWPEDTVEKEEEETSHKVLEVTSTIQICLRTNKSAEHVKKHLQAKLEEFLETFSQDEITTGEGCALVDDKAQVEVKESEE